MAAKKSKTTTKTGKVDKRKLKQVKPTRFQILDVKRKSKLHFFVKRNGLSFKPGCSFYEFTKPETISSKMEIVLLDKVGNYQVLDCI